MIHKIATLAGKVVDYYDDPDFIESQSTQNLISDGKLMRPEDLENLPDSAFACKLAGASTLKRAFPCYNVAATALSIHYFRKSASLLPQSAIDEAIPFLKAKADEFGFEFPADITKLAGQMTSPDPEILINFMVTDYLSKYALLNMKERKEQAGKIYNIAKSAGKPVVDPRVISYVLTEKFGSNLKEGLAQREKLVKTAGDVYLEKVWEYSKEKLAAMKDPEEVAEYLEAFDKLAFHASHSASMPKDILDPIRTVGGGIGEASTGETCPKKEMKGVDKKEIKDIPEGSSSQSTASTTTAEDTKRKLWEISQLLHKAKMSGSLPTSTNAKAQMVNKIIENPVRVYEQLSDKARKWLLALHEDLQKRYMM